MQSEDQIVGGTVLRIPAIQSPNFVHDVAGWFIGQDGSAEFNNLTIRGTFNGTDYVINASGLFFYNGTPAAGNLITSITNASGTDGFGNAYLAGVTTYYSDERVAMSIGIAASGSEALIVQKDSGSPTPGQIGLQGSLVINGEPALLGTPDGGGTQAILGVNGSSGWYASLIQAIIPSGGAVETWHSFSSILNANWSTANAEYRAMPDGTVQFQGSITYTGSLASGATACTLGTGYRPLISESAQSSNIFGSTAFAQASVKSTGDLDLFFAGSPLTNPTFALDGIRYPVI